ncbi:MAG: hypothetical protein ACYDHC_06505 [Desulfuromonadaceae bacterium]
MSTTTLSAGPLHKLKSAFKEIFGKQAEAPNLEVSGRDDKPARPDRKKNQL